MVVMTSKQKVVKLSAIDEDILTLLVGREMYGLKILAALNRGRPTQLGFGSLYPALNRLNKKELIAWTWGDDNEQTGGARRKYYRVTDLGERSLRQVQEYRIHLASDIETEE
ncbi:MAG: helix-turn-helix transcriptional regulator [Cyanobacteria bacterium J06648_11]